MGGQGKMITVAHGGREYAQKIILEVRIVIDYIPIGSMYEQGQRKPRGVGKARREAGVLKRGGICGQKNNLGSSQSHPCFQLD